MRSVVAGRTLLDVAGPPAGIVTTAPGSVPSPAGITPLGPRTIYLVLDIINTASAWSSLVTSGDNVVTNGALHIQSYGVGVATLGIRLDTSGGVSNLGLGQAGSRLPGRRLMWAQVAAGLTAVRMAVDKAAVHASIAVPTPGAGIPSPALIFHSSNASSTHLCTVAYAAEHDLATRRRVLDWLARRYGATPPQAQRGDIWWDDLVIVEGVYNGPYRDGDSPGWAWLGAPGWSQSAGPGGL